MNTIKLGLLIALTTAPAHGMLSLGTKNVAVSAAFLARHFSTPCQIKNDFSYRQVYFCNDPAFLEPEKIRQMREEQSADIKELLKQLKELKAEISQLKTNQEQLATELAQKIDKTEKYLEKEIQMCTY